MERSVLQGRRVSKEELQPHRPGGASNTDKGVRGWLRYFAVLHRKHALLMEQDFAPEADAVLIAALRAEPVAVLLSDSTGATDHGLAAYPKSFEALLELQKRDDAVGWLTARYLMLREKLAVEFEADLLAFAQRVLNEIAHQYQVLAWIVTTPGPGMPFALGEEPEVPEHIRTLDPLDVLSIVRAHVQVNALRLRVLKSMMSPDNSPNGRERPTWAMFFSNAGVELKKPARELMRDHSLVEVLAMLQLHNIGTRDAYDDAKRQAGAA